MLDIVRLPDPPRVVFETPPLRLALCQIRFPRLLTVANPPDVAPFQRAIKAEYPILPPGPTLEFGVALGPGANLKPTPPVTEWRFTDRQQAWTVVLTQEFIAIETRRYDRFEDFLGRLRRLLTSLGQHLEPDAVTRIGLRYVNEIRVDELPWSEVVRRELLGPVAVPELSDLVRQSVQEIVLRSRGDDSQGVTLRHGVLPDGSTVAPLPGQEPPGGPFYLLDIDVARTFSIPNLPMMDPDEICQGVSEYHRVIKRVFHWALRDEYLSTLEGRRDPR